jgi:AcrR family transcriptional regulator
MSMRTAILEAALRLAADRPLAALSTAELCRASGASNGSMFHHFPTREALAAALYARALGRFQQAVLAGLARTRTARGGFRALLNAHVEWVREHPVEARFLHELRHAGADDADIRARNHAFTAQLGGWLKARVDAGQIRPVPFEALFAQLFGPVQMLTRDWLKTGDAHKLRALAHDLAELAAGGLVISEQPRKEARP